MSDVIWLTSRSTFETGTQNCAFRRWIENHSGPTGYGIQRRAQSLPLVTGTYAHEGIASILQWVLDARLSSGIQPSTAPDEVIRWACEVAIDRYRKVIDDRGILNFTEQDSETQAKLLYLKQEQEYLIEGLTWAWCLYRLPAYLEEYTLLEVEGEQEIVFDCDCGMGEGIGDFTAHALRGCNGIGYQSKPDALGERKSDQKIGYTEFKTAGIANKGLNESWERKQQFILGTLGAERKYGVEVSHIWVETLVKGQRKRDYPYTDLTMPKRQSTPLCHAYFAPGNPPTSEASWRPSFNYYTAEGLKYTAGKKEGYTKRALWEVDPEQGFPGKPQEMSVVEYWVRTLQQDYPYHLEKTISLIGPIPKQRDQVEKAKRAVVCEERIWQDRVWRIYEYGQQTGKGWGDDDFMRFVETVVPRSYKCDPFAEHPCPQQVVCHAVTEDWRDPMGSDLFVPRRPHHTPELNQVQARMIDAGMELPEGLAQEADELEEMD